MKNSSLKHYFFNYKKNNIKPTRDEFLDAKDTISEEDKPIEKLKKAIMMNDITTCNNEDEIIEIVEIKEDNKVINSDFENKSK